MTFCQFSLVQPLYWLQNSNLFLDIFGVRSGFFKGFREGSFRFLLKRWRIVLVDTSASSATDFLHLSMKNKVCLRQPPDFSVRPWCSFQRPATPFHWRQSYIFLVSLKYPTYRSFRKSKLAFNFFIFVSFFL